MGPPCGAVICCAHGVALFSFAHGHLHKTHPKQYPTLSLCPSVSFSLFYTRGGGRAQSTRLATGMFQIQSPRFQIQSPVGFQLLFGMHNLTERTASSPEQHAIHGRFVRIPRPLPAANPFALVDHLPYSPLKHSHPAETSGVLRPDICFCSLVGMRLEASCIGSPVEAVGSRQSAEGNRQ